MKKLIQRLRLMELMERTNRDHPDLIDYDPKFHEQLIEGIRVLEQRQSHVEAGTQALYDNIFGNQEAEASE